MTTPNTRNKKEESIKMHANAHPTTPNAITIILYSRQLMSFNYQSVLSIISDLFLKLIVIHNSLVRKSGHI